MKTVRELLAAIRELTAAINALRRQLGGGVSPQGNGGPGEEGGG